MSNGFWNINVSKFYLKNNLCNENWNVLCVLLSMFSCFHDCVGTDFFLKVKPRKSCLMFQCGPSFGFRLAANVLSVLQNTNKQDTTNRFTFCYNYLFLCVVLKNISYTVLVFSTRRDGDTSL